jgi:hypothetical protein
MTGGTVAKRQHVTRYRTPTDLCNWSVSAGWLIFGRERLMPTELHQVRSRQDPRLPENMRRELRDAVLSPDKEIDRAVRRSCPR